SEPEKRDGHHAKRPSCSLCRKADNDALEFRGVRRHIAEWSELVECAGNPAASRGLPGFARGSSGVGYCL
ncbi:hypothetical protein, partial [Pseudomonas aeruginosa]|uniref:hypothetical protein n=1 Tax=Pseudomonas aeruginosa TaxID=287 RepID=UPI001ED9BE2D